MSRISLVALVALIAGVSVTGCGYEEEDPTKDPNLVALKQEKMATFTPGGRLVLKSEETDHTSSLYNDHVVAYVVRIFAFSDPERARHGRAAAVEAASGSGWKLNLDRGPNNAIFGEKELATGSAMITIHEYEDKDESVHKVSIRLDHERCRTLC